MMKFNAKAVYVLDTVKMSEDIEALEDATQVSWPMSSSRLDEIKQLTKDDAELQTLIRCVSEDWSKYAFKVPNSIMQCKNFLTTSSNLLLYDNRIVAQLPTVRGC